MNAKYIVLLVSALVMLSGVCNLSAKPEKKSCQADTAAVSKTAHQATTFTVPDLTKKTARKMSKAIAKTPGIISAKPDFKNNTLTVVFSTQNGSSQAIHTALTKVAPKATIGKTVTLDEKAVKVGCGACPSKSQCPSRQKKK